MTIEGLRLGGLTGFGGIEGSASNNSRPSPGLGRHSGRVADMS